MSLSSLANAAIARRTDFPPVGKAPRKYAEIAWAASNPPLHAIAPADPAADAPTAAPVDTTMNVLTGYIPTEILTCYVAFVAALHSSAKPMMDAEWIAFWCFLVVTPVVFWLVYAAKVKGADKALPLSFSSLPLWEMVASTIAFAAWAFALPNSPFARLDWYSSAIAGLVILLASTVLGLLAPIFGGSQLRP